MQRRESAFKTNLSFRQSRSWIEQWGEGEILYTML